MKLYERISNKLSRKLQDPSFDLASIGAMAESWGVSYTTMWKAVRLLSKKGLLEVTRGKNLRKAHDTSTSSHIGRSEQKLYAWLTGRIQSGRIRLGAELPQYSYLVERQGVSPTTITRVLRRMENQGLIHKRGKRWIVGQSDGHPESGALRTIKSSRPTVLLIFQGIRLPLGFLSSPLVDNFMHRFMREIENQGIFLAVHSVDVQGIEETGGEQQLIELETHIRSLGSRYLGSVLLVSSWGRPSEPLARQALMHEKPVIILDHTGSPSTFSRNTFAKRSERLRKNLYRFNIDEPRAVELALELAYHLGHRRIGIPVPDDPSSGHSWCRRRIEIFEERVANRYKDCELVVVPHADEKSIWEVRGLGRIPLTSQGFILQRQELFAAADSGQPGLVSSHSPRKTLREKTPSMQRLFEKEVTLLIGLNDNFLREYYLWLQTMEIKVPESISLLGFDNSLTARLFQFTSIDFGFERLGYLAAHILLGDIPIRVGNDGVVPGEPFCVDRGSVDIPEVSSRK